MKRTCPRCSLPITDLRIGHRTVETVPVGREVLYLVATVNGEAVCSGRMRGDISDPMALHAVHRAHGCEEDS